MKKALTLVVAGIVCATFVACQPGAAGLSDQDKAAIRKVVDEGSKVAVAGKGDYAAYVQLYYAEDATVLMPNTPPVQRRAAIQAALASFPPITEFKTDIVDLDGRGDLAYVRGDYAMTMAPPGAPPMMDKGKYVEVWKKGPDGVWKVSYDSWSSDLPVPGLVVPTGSMSANAGAEVKTLGTLVGKWQITGTTKAERTASPSPVAVSLDCQWHANGLDIVCAYSGTTMGQPYQDFDIYSYHPTSKSYTIYSVANPGGAMQGSLSIQPSGWVHIWKITIGGKAAELRLTLTNVTPEGGDWKNDMSIAGGPWTPIGEGKYMKAK